MKSIQLVREGGGGGDVPEAGNGNNLYLVEKNLILLALGQKV